MRNLKNGGKALCKKLWDHLQIREKVDLRSTKGVMVMSQSKVHSIGVYGGGGGQWYLVYYFVL